MTAKDLILKQTDESGAMLRRALKDWPSTGLTQKLHPEGFTVGEHVEHLSECLVAIDTHLKGAEHEWGSFQTQATDLESAVEEWARLRTGVIAAIEASEGDQALDQATDYIVNHDNYHVGQLCALRFLVQPEWSPYAVYGME